MSYPEVKPLIRDLDIIDDPSESSLSKASADITNQVSIRHPTSNYKLCTVARTRRERDTVHSKEDKVAHNDGKVQSLLS